MKLIVILIALCSLLAALDSSTQRTFPVINGTLVVGERASGDQNDVLLFDATTDSTIVTTSTVYSYDDLTENVIVTGNVFPPDTFVRCNVGCHWNLINLADCCHRVNPPTCIEMKSKTLIVYNVTSSDWFDDQSSFMPNSFYTTYSIVY